MSWYAHEYEPGYQDMTQECDAIIIGTGQSGPSGMASRALVALLSVLVRISRLSVMPAREREWRGLRELSGA
jgi:hypothetical protein